LLEYMETILRLINGLFTLGIFYFLFRLNNKAGKRFFLFWSLGFLLYGVNIIIRTATPLYLWDRPDPVQWSAFALNMTGFLLIMAGIGDLVNRVRRILTMTLAVPLIPVMSYLVSGPAFVGWAFTLGPYSLVALSLMYIRVQYGVPLDLFITGWVVLLLINASIPLRAMDPAYIELFAILGKAIIFVGMINPTFSFLVEDLKYLSTAPSGVYHEGNTDHLILLRPTSTNRAREIEWISNKVKENSAKSRRTVIITLYDLISPKDVRYLGLDKSELYLVRMMPGGGGDVPLGDGVLTIRDDLDQLDFLLTDLVGYTREREIDCDVILHTLSTLVHTQGWKRVYSLFISRMPALKSSGIHLYCFYYPETHEDKSEISKFEKLADRIIEI